MKITRIHTNIREAMQTGRGRLSKREEKARREFNVWAWEQNGQGRQAPVGHG